MVDEQNRSSILKKSFNLNTLLFVFILLVFNQYISSQTHALRASPPKDIDKFIMSSRIKDKAIGKHMSYKYIYITDNSSYTTFVPNFRVDSLQYEFPNFPTFTYLKDFDVFVVKKHEEKEILSHDEFSKSRTYKPTNEFKNYFGIKAQTYATENNFYECSLLVTEGESNIEEHPFLKVLKELKLLKLQPNQKVVAINYLGIELDIDHFTFKLEYRRRSINEDIYTDDLDEEDNAENSNFEEIYDAQEVQHLLNKSYTFDSKQDITFRSFSNNNSVDSLNLFKNNKTGNSISIYKNYFTLNLDKNFIRGQINDDGSLQPENYYKSTDTTNADVIDLKDFNLISKKSSADEIELILQKKKGFWNFYKYVISTKPNNETNLKTFILPENSIIKGQLETSITFSASYASFNFERSTKQEKEKPLEQSKMFFINE